MIKINTNNQKQDLFQNEKNIILNDKVLFKYHRDVFEDSIFCIYQNGDLGICLLDETKDSEIIATIEMTEKQRNAIKKLYIMETGDFEEDDAFQLFYVSDIFKIEEDNKNEKNNIYGLFPNVNLKDINLNFYLEVFLASLEIKWEKIKK